MGLRLGEAFKAEITTLLQKPTVTVKGTYTAAYQAYQHMDNGGEHGFSVVGNSFVKF